MSDSSPTPLSPEVEGCCGNRIYHMWAEASSTNDLAKYLPPGHIAACRIQTGGRGRFNRPWIGEEGGLWASYTVPLSGDQPDWGQLPLVAGMALLNMLHSFGINEARLRWPNDLLIGNAKLAGILVERPATDKAVIGIGINIRNDVDKLIGIVKDPPTRLADHLDPCPDLFRVMELLGTHLDETLTTFSQHGLSALLSRPEQIWGAPRPVRIETDDDFFCGLFAGIDETGNPVLSLGDGEFLTIPAYTVNRLTEDSV